MEVLAACIRIAALQLVLVGEGDGMHQKVDRAPLLAQGLEHAIHRGNVFDIAGQHGFRADAVRQRGHPLVQALALIGKGQFGALIGQRLGNAPGNRMVVGDTHYKSALAAHQ